MPTEHIQKALPWAGGAILVLALRGLGLLDGGPAVAPAPIVWPAAAQAAAPAPAQPQLTDLARLSVQLENVAKRFEEFAERTDKHLDDLKELVSDLRERVTKVEARR